MTVEKTDVSRRAALEMIGALGAAVAVGCGGNVAVNAGSSASSSSSSSGGGEGGAGGGSSSSSSSSAASSTSSSSSSSSGSTAECAEIPDETGGPYPDVDGMISNTTYERSDVTEGKTGTPLSLTLTVVDVANACAPIVGARVIIWHCDANGVYSEYATSMNSDPAQNDVGSATTTYLRGWQVTDATGAVTFKTIFPGWYTPRVTHIHVMVYNPSDLTTPVKTTQFTFEDTINEAVYAQASLYPKGQNSTTVASDMVFGASTENLIATVTGSTSSGYAASLPIGLTSY